MIFMMMSSSVYANGQPPKLLEWQGQTFHVFEQSDVRRMSQYLIQLDFLEQQQLHRENIIKALEVIIKAQEQMLESDRLVKEEQWRRIGDLERQVELSKRVVRGTWWGRFKSHSQAVLGGLVVGIVVGSVLASSK